MRLSAKRKMNKLMNKIDTMVIGFCNSAANHKFKKERGINGLIVEVAIIAIAIALLIIFKDGIKGTIDTFLTNVGTKINTTFFATTA